MAHKVIPTATKGSVNQTTDMKLQLTTEISKGKRQSHKWTATTQVTPGSQRYPSTDSGTLQNRSSTLIIGHSTLKTGSGTFKASSGTLIITEETARAVAQP